MGSSASRVFEICSVISTISSRDTVPSGRSTVRLSVWPIDARPRLNVTNSTPRASRIDSQVARTASDLSGRGMLTSSSQGPVCAAQTLLLAVRNLVDTDQISKKEVGPRPLRPAVLMKAPGTTLTPRSCSDSSIRRFAQSGPDPRRVGSRWQPGYVPGQEDNDE